MWQIYSILSLFISALENSIDKMAVIQSEKLDPIIMSFYRVLVFVVIMFLIWLIWIDWKIFLLFDWRIILFWIFSITLSLSYTYVLKNIEVTSIATLSYLWPIIYLLIDKFLINANFSSYQILGILFLVIWGIWFSIEWKTFKFKEEISLKILGVFIFLLIYAWIEWYLFKFMNSEYHVNATTFFANVWWWTTVMLFIVIILKWKFNNLLDKSVVKYVTKSIISKSCDVWKSLFFAKALTLASVSQVSAMTSFEPFVLLIVTILIQKIMKIHLNERLDTHNMILKISMVIILILWWIMVR